MARRIVSITTQTPTGTNDTTALLDGTYPFYLLGGSSTQVNYVHEISISGLAASASSPMVMLFARDSTVAGTPAAGTVFDAAISPATAALAAPPVTGNSATTDPQRSSTLHLMNCSLNAYGGSYFWRANKLDEAVNTLGNTASLGEVSLSMLSGTAGAIGAHMIYEPL